MRIEHKANCATLTSEANFPKCDCGAVRRKFVARQEDFSATGLGSGQMSLGNGNYRRMASRSEV